MLLRQFLDGSRNRKSLSKEKRLTLWKQAHGRCWYCGTEVAKAAFVLEHVDPVSRGGANSKRNLVVSCYDCDKAKGRMNLEEFREIRGGIFFYGEPRRPMKNGCQQNLVKKGNRQIKQERKRRLQHEIRLQRMVNVGEAMPIELTQRGIHV